LFIVPKPLPSGNLHNNGHEQTDSLRSASLRPVKLRSLQAARGLAAVLVVICHASAFVGDEPELWHRVEVYRWLRGGALGVQLFFVLSGVVIWAAHRKDIGRPSSLPSFLWKRFRRIYPLYWLFFLLTVARQIVDPRTAFSYQKDPWVIASGILLVHLFSVRTNMVVAWTLFDEVMFYIGFAALLLRRNAGIVILTLWMGASFFFLTPSESYLAVIFSPNHLLFGLGILVAWRLERKDPRYANRYAVRYARALLAVGVAVFLSCVLLAGHAEQYGMAVRLIAGVGAAGALMGAVEIERRGGWKIPEWLSFLGDASYSIYLAHFMVVSTVARIGYARWGKLPIPSAAWVAVLVLCGTGAGILVHLLVERPLLRRLGRNN
jgi:exopolysaccharide production protein ExoZ